ncbi:relaxase/mobilization nuclease domain-containing protein [Chlorogloeopsis sp. ULAP02]|uniref:relaxase/mobilization nuclease domain-containing protein n=1 Tax=Chlorogloeopsis sp. ULAP02 TaxID=3107926 RepID=UPI00313601C1
MIPVIYKKAGFLDTLKYVLGKESAVIIDTNMTGKIPEEFNRQFLTTKYTNKAVKRQCAHLIIAIAHREGYHEHLSDSQYNYVAREYLTDMEYLPKEQTNLPPSQYVVVRHHDRDHEHLHIIASRIRLDGSLVDDSYDYFNCQASTRRIAAELGLEVTPTTSEAIASRLKQEYGIIAPISPNRSKSIRQINSKHKNPTSKEIIRSKIEEAIQNSPTVSTFIQRLEENNIRVLPKMRGLELLGFTYIHNNIKIAGYQVYKPYSWNKLQSEYGLTYDYKRDIAVLEQAKTKAINRRDNITLPEVTSDLENQLSAENKSWAESILPTIGKIWDLANQTGKIKLMDGVIKLLKGKNYKITIKGEELTISSLQDDREIASYNLEKNTVLAANPIDEDKQYWGKLTHKQSTFTQNKDIEFLS